MDTNFWFQNSSERFINIFDQSLSLVQLLRWCRQMCRAEGCGSLVNILTFVSISVSNDENLMYSCPVLGDFLWFLEKKIFVLKIPPKVSCNFLIPQNFSLMNIHLELHHPSHNSPSSNIHEHSVVRRKF